MPLGVVHPTPGGETGDVVLELAAADVWATGVSPDSYPTQFLRADLDELGVTPAERLLSVPDGTRVLIAGAVVLLVAKRKTPPAPPVAG